MSPRGQAGPAMRHGDVPVSAQHTALYDAYGRELARMIELVRSGEAFTEPVMAERLLVRLVGVLMRLHEGHQVDDHGRCSSCRPSPGRWWFWPRRTFCTVHAAFASHHQAATVQNSTPAGGGS